MIEGFVNIRNARNGKTFFEGKNIILDIGKEIFLKKITSNKIFSISKIAFGDGGKNWKLPTNDEKIFAPKEWPYSSTLSLGHIGLANSSYKAGSFQNSSDGSRIIVESIIDRSNYASLEFSEYNFEELINNFSTVFSGDTPATSFFEDGEDMPFSNITTPVIPFHIGSDPIYVGWKFYLK